MKSFNIPDQIEGLRESLLSAVSEVADLRYITVRDAAVKIGISAEQLNHILRNTMGKVSLLTIAAIYHKAGKEFSLSHSVEDHPKPE